MDLSIAPELRPDGYPAELEQWIELGDGRMVFVRPVIPEDAPLLQGAIETADSETVYQRFLRAPVRLDGRQLDRLTRLDYATRMAMAAFDPDGNGVAIARYEDVEPGVAEIAVAVDPAWRTCGMATALFDILEQVATESGVERMTAVFLPGNRPIANLLAGRGYVLAPPDGAVAGADKVLVR